MTRSASLAFVVALVCLGSPAVAEPKTPQEAITANTALVIETLDQLTEDSFGLDEASVEYLDGYINRNREQWIAEGTDDRLTQIIASYLGDAMIAKYGGTWTKTENGFGVEVAPEIIAYPFAKTRKHIQNGPDDSIHSLYLAVGDVLADRKAKN